MILVSHIKFNDANYLLSSFEVIMTTRSLVSNDILFTKDVDDQGHKTEQSKAEQTGFRAEPSQNVLILKYD